MNETDLILKELKTHSPLWSSLLRKEIDRLRAEVKVSHDEYYRLEADRDRLKADLTQLHIESQRLITGFLKEKVVEQLNIVEKDRDLWKMRSDDAEKEIVRLNSKAEKLAEALKLVVNCTGLNCDRCRKKSIDALAEFEEWGFR